MTRKPKLKTVHNSYIKNRSKRHLMALRESRNIKKRFLKAHKMEELSG